MRIAPGEATGLGATHPASDEKLSEDRLLGEAPGGTSSTHLLWLVLSWERLHRFELLPCWSDARRRPPASRGGYTCSGPWSLLDGGLPHNWIPDFKTNLHSFNFRTACAL